MVELDKIICGDCREELPAIPEDSIDAIITDPPAGIAFMGKEWDKDKGGRNAWIAWMEEVAFGCLRVIKPGGHALVWALPRTSHWTGMAWENAGWEPRDKISHVFGSGFPKSLDISKALDKMAGAEREVIGNTGRDPLRLIKFKEQDGCKRSPTNEDITAPATPAAKQWARFGTALKPAHEDWWLFRKPLDQPTIAANVLRWGCGGLNIDACRISTNQNDPNIRDNASHGGSATKFSGRAYNNGEAGGEVGRGPQLQNGRFPANLIHDGSQTVLAEFAKAGERKTGIAYKNASGTNKIFGAINKRSSDDKAVNGGDTGSAARFFQSCPFTEDDIPAFMYYAKSSRSERNVGLDGTCTVKLITDNGLIEDLCLNKKDANMVAVQLLQRVISESMVKWSIVESGESIMALCPWASLSTTLTEINRIIESRTLPSLMHSLINDTTQDVSLSMVDGGSHADTVESLRRWILTITNDSPVLALGASRVALKMLSQTSEKGS